MANTSASKGNPAHTRMANLRRKARMASSWVNGQRKHQRNADANNLLHMEKVEAGGLGRRELRRIAAGLRGTEGGYGKDLTGVSSLDKDSQV